MIEENGMTAIYLLLMLMSAILIYAMFKAVAESIREDEASKYHALIDKLQDEYRKEIISLKQEHQYEIEWIHAREKQKEIQRKHELHHHLKTTRANIADAFEEKPSKVRKYGRMAK